MEFGLGCIEFMFSYLEQCQCVLVQNGSGHYTGIYFNIFAFNFFVCVNQLPTVSVDFV